MRAACVASLAFAIVACGSDQAARSSEARRDSNLPTRVATEPSIPVRTTSTIVVVDATPTGSPASPVPSPTASATAALIDYPPNELGQIPILQYHHFGDESDQFTRTPEQFRADLQWLYDHSFYVVNLRDIVAGTIDAPGGKRPVALTFDDSPASQFRLITMAQGQLAIDRNSAVGVMEIFFAEHPDFGRGGHFSVLPNKLFDWTRDVYEEDQAEFGTLKLEWLRDNGYEIGNHTLDHVNLARTSGDDIRRQLALANDAIHERVPGVPVDVITLPYGGYPSASDVSLLRGFEYNGRRYRWSAALMVGANPANSPYSRDFDPYMLARIQAFDEQLDAWFSLFETDPGILYVSDGDPERVTVPKSLHPWLVGTLDESKIGDRDLVRR